MFLSIEFHRASVGIDYKEKVILIENKTVKFQIWDTGKLSVYIQ